MPETGSGLGLLFMLLCLLLKQLFYYILLIPNNEFKCILIRILKIGFHNPLLLICFINCSAQNLKYVKYFKRITFNYWFI